MKSLPVRPVQKVLPIAPPRGAREAYQVISRDLGHSRTSTYDVVVWLVDYYWQRKHKIVPALRLTCECLASQYARPCRHILNVLKRRMPTATFWLTEDDAVRQHRRYYPVLYSVNPVTTTRWVRPRVLWITERYAFRHKRSVIKRDGSVSA